jgi:hypothetical protein
VMIEARIDVVRSANLSWVRIAGPQSFKVAATFLLISVTTVLEVQYCQLLNLKLFQRTIE